MIGEKTGAVFHIVLPFTTVKSPITIPKNTLPFSFS